MVYVSPAVINNTAPDFHFIAIENTQNKPNFKIFEWANSAKRLKSIGTIGTPLEMNCLLNTSLSIGYPDVYFAPDFPHFLLEKDNPSYSNSPTVIDKVITWGVVRKEPGSVSGTPFRGTQEVKPRQREYLALLSDKNKQWIVGSDESSISPSGGLIKYIKVKAQAFDVLIQYNIWTKTNFEAEETIEWFEDYMMRYTGMFMEAGIVNMWFDRRVRDDVISSMKNGYHVRSVLYYIRMERVTPENVSPIHKIDLKVNVTDLQQTYMSVADQEIDPSLHNKIVQKWVNLLN